MTVLILTHAEDRTADRVAAELALRGVPVARIDQADIPLRVAVDGRIGPRSQWCGQMRDRQSGAVIADLASVRSVWHRHTRQFVVDPRMSGPEKVFAYGEARRGYGGVLAALGINGCLWVNDPVAAARCEYKPVQLQAAASCGLRIPETIITSDPAAATDWAATLGRPVVYKPMSGSWHADEGMVRVLHTTLVDDPSSLGDHAIARTAHLFQEAIWPKAFEARAVVVGEQVFAVRIDANSEQGRVDWRSDYDSLSYSPLELPAEITEGLVRLHRALGLMYGAADLACDMAERYWFLETNQAGEWGWLAERAGLPIARALADLLAADNRP